MTGLTIAMTTWRPPGEDGEKREAAAREALQSWQNLIFPCPNIIVGDDGSTDIGYPMRLFNLANAGRGGSTIDYEVEAVIVRRRGVGATLNAGMRAAFDRDDQVLYVVDDWRLDEMLDLRPWMAALEANEDIGCIRLGPPHPNTSGKVIAIGEAWNNWALELNREDRYVASLRPALYHRRFIDAYGWFKEGVSSYECEDDLSDRYSRGSGPKVVLALPHPWFHLDTVELAGVVPG